MGQYCVTIGVEDKCFYSGFIEGEYLAIDIGGNMRVNGLRAIIVAWLNAFQRSRVGVGMN